MLYFFQWKVSTGGICVELYREVGKRIREARESLGLTQEGLAKAIERVTGQPFSAVKISYFETGVRHPKLEDLENFAIALGKPLEYLLTGVEPRQQTDNLLRVVLLRATRALNPTTQRHVSELVDLILNSPVRDGLELPLVPRKTPTEILSILGITVPQVDLNRIAFASGIQVETREMDDSISGLVVVTEGHTGIVVNKFQSPTQQRFAIAHELGHLWLGHYPALEVALNMNSTARSVSMDPVMEHQADQFARELLMPETWLQEDWLRYGGDLRAIAERYGVGVQALWIRLHELGIVKGPIV